MKSAVILAGGLGTRLRPVTYEIPKPLIPVQGKPLLVHVIDVLREAGVENVYLSIGYMADKIEEQLGDGSWSGVHITYIVEDTPLGTGGWMHLVPREEFDDDFIVVNGDNLFDIDFNDVLKLHKENDALITIALKHQGDVEAFGVAELDGDKITKFVEKPKKEDAPSNYINSGYYIFSPKIFDKIPEEDKFMLEKQFFSKIAEEGKLFGFKSDAQWFDTGTFDRWERVINEWRKRK